MSCLRKHLDDIWVQREWSLFCNFRRLWIMKIRLCPGLCCRAKRQGWEGIGEKRHWRRQNFNLKTVFLYTDLGKMVLLGMWEVSVVISKSEFSKSIWSAVSLDLPPACDQLIQGGALLGEYWRFFILTLTTTYVEAFWWFGLLPEARIKHLCNFIFFL